MSEAAGSRAVVAGGESSAARRSPAREPAIAPGRGAGNQAMQAAVVGAGMPLEASARRRAEAGLGIGLGHVRVHRGAAAEAAALGVNARAFTAGNHIVLGRRAGPESLAHELVHIAQTQRFGEGAEAGLSARSDAAEQEAHSLAPQLLAGASPLAVRAPPRAAVQLDEEYVIVPVAGTAEPLGAYAGLKERIPIGDWNALNAAARRRADKVLTGKASTEPGEQVKPEIDVVLDALFEPPAHACFATGGDQWLTDLFDLAMGGAGGAAMGKQIQDEILNRWLNANEGILFENVTISLVDPEGKGGGAGGLLTFSLRGVPVTAVRGALTLKAVDEAIQGGAGAMIEEVSGQLAGLAGAVEKAAAARAMLAAARDIAAKGHEKIAADALTQIDAAMRGGVTDLESIKDSPFDGLVQSYASELQTYVDGDFASLIAAHEKWRADNPRKPSIYETTKQMAEENYAEAKRLRQEGGFWNHMKANDLESKASDQIDSLGAQQMFSGGEVLREEQLGLAYDAGLVSFDTFSRGAEASRTRGGIFALVTVGLMVATAGLGFVVGPMSLGGAILFGAGTGLVTGVAPMLASNIYTSYEDFQDPGLQQWWKSGMYSAGDIALSGAIGAGIGAAFPIAGRLLGGLRGQGAQAVAALEAGAPLPEGVVARTVQKGVVELTIASEGVTVRVTTKGYQVIGQAGTKTQAVIDEALWPKGMVGEEGFAPGTSIDMDFPGYPSSIRFGERGWMMASPKSSMPIQFDFWPELALPGGGGGVQPASTVSPLLLEAAAGGKFLPVAGGESMMVMSGMHMPHGFPTTGMPAGQTFSSFLQSPLVGGGSLFPGARPPLMLGPGPAAAQPFVMPPFAGFGASQIPRSLIGPHRPGSFESGLSPEWADLAMTRVRGSLPDLGPFGEWVPTARGWVPSYFILPPGGVPEINLTTYGTGGASDFMVDVPGRVKTAIAMPRPGGTYKGPRDHPMESSDMVDPITGEVYGQGHVFPQAQTKDAGPGQVLSSTDPRNFVAHNRKYNEWFRNQMEQKLKREGTPYTMYVVMGRNPRLTSGGYAIPEAEIFVQFAPDGSAAKAWRFPLGDPNFYTDLKASGSFNDVLPDFELTTLAEVPRAARQ